MTRPSFVVAPAPGQESVWDFPRPPRLEPVAKRVHIVLAGEIIADTMLAAIRDHIAFYPAPMDGCFVGDERVTPQPGGFYGGWVTADLAGPFKGEPGTMGW